MAKIDKLEEQFFVASLDRDLVWCQVPHLSRRDLEVLLISVRTLILVAVASFCCLAPPQAQAQETRITLSETDPQSSSELIWRVDNAPPKSEISIVARTTGLSTNWRSEASFIADEFGVVDPKLEAPVSGSYSTVWPMGMIWTMRPEDEMMSTFDPGLNYTIELSILVDDQFVARADVARNSVLHSGDLVTSEVAVDGLHGRLWKPSKQGVFPAILYLGGSGGTLNNAEAAQLARAGFVVLDLLYFGKRENSDLPEHLTHIPIEYFIHAVDWLSEQPHVMSDGIGVYGHSRGSEAAILLSANHAQINAVVVRSPSAVVWAGPGINGFGKSAWTLRGEELPFLSLGLNDGLSWLRKVSNGNKMIATRQMFERPLAKKRKVEAALLPVHQIAAPILIISGQDDMQWPSDVMSELLVEKLKSERFAYEFSHVSFKDAGHRPGIPYTPLPNYAQQTFANGGTAQGNANAGVLGLQETLAFYAKHLMPAESP